MSEIPGLTYEYRRHIIPYQRDDWMFRSNPLYNNTCGCDKKRDSIGQSTQRSNGELAGENIPHSLLSFDGKPSTACVYNTQTPTLLRSSGVLARTNIEERLANRMENREDDYIQGKCTLVHKEIAYFIAECGTYPEKVVSHRWNKPTGMSIFVVIRLCREIKEKALEWFPHNKNDHIPYKVYNFGDELPYLKWCKFTINIRFNQPIAPNAIILDFGSPISADCNWASHRIICKYVFNRMRRELNWTERKSYLELVEGCTIKENSHIIRFMFDPTIVREVSSYLSPFSLRNSSVVSPENPSIPTLVASLRNCSLMTTT
jgi:hypothetical protein